MALAENEFVFSCVVFRTVSAHCKIKFGSDSATALPDPFGTLALDSRKKEDLVARSSNVLFCARIMQCYTTQDMSRERERESYL